MEISGKFVAVARTSSNGSNAVMYSTDGINWTDAPSSRNETSWSSIVCSEEKGLFVAEAWGGTNRVMYSTDSINWTVVPAADETASWEGITYGNGIFVAVAKTGSKLITNIRR